MTVHRIEVQKVSQKTLNHEKVKTQLDGIRRRILGGGRQERGWQSKLAPHWDTPVTNPSGAIVYTATFLLQCKPKRKRSAESLANELEKIVKVVQAAGNAPGWLISKLDGDQEAAKVFNPNTEVPYVDVALPEDWRKNFSHIYGRDEQVDLVVSAVAAGIRSDWKHRFHTVLVGPPAGGKTEICRSLITAVGSEACLQYDATATTQAGAIEDLRKRDELPRILVIEEIEKTDEASLRWLLGVLDERGEVRKTTFRNNVQFGARLLGVATVNDYPLFLRLMDGALASRFCNPIHCPPPDRGILTRILEREIDAVQGKREWIAPVLDFAELHSIHDPRRLKSICLCGRDDLLTGEYQAKLERCILPS